MLTTHEPRSQQALISRKGRAAPLIVTRSIEVGSGFNVRAQHVGGLIEGLNENAVRKVFPA